MKPHSQKFLQQRRFYMVLPLLVLPFVTMIFWALGGGQGRAAPVGAKTSGLNTELPGAHFDKEDELWNKFALYEQAKRDSLQYEEARRNDPYYVVSTLTPNGKDTVPSPDSKLNTSLGHKDRYAPIQEQERLIEEKLQQLSGHLQQPQLPQPEGTKDSAPVRPVIATDETMTSDVDRLEQMMALMASSDMNDPEMQQIEGLIDKILDLQHPERVRERLRTQHPTPVRDALEVTTVQKPDPVSLVETGSGMVPDEESLVYAVQLEANGFFGLEEDLAVDQTHNAIEAVVHDTQTLVNGSTVKLRLISEVRVKDRLLPEGQFIYGTCTISGERLMISVNSIRDESSLLPVALTVHDLDGLEGIYIPGAITRDAAKQASDNALQNMDLMSLDMSLGAQAASTGVEAAKGLFSKKAKLIKVTVKAGYQVLLRDTDSKML